MPKSVHKFSVLGYNYSESLWQSFVIFRGLFITKLWPAYKPCSNSRFFLILSSSFSIHGLSIFNLLNIQFYTLCTGFYNYNDNLNNKRGVRL